MARTQTDFLNIILRAQCCAADMAYKGLKEEMFLRPSRNTTYKQVKYIQALIGILNRYYDTKYILVDTPCLSDTQIETIIQQVYSLCDQCGCYTNPVSAATISPSPTPVTKICNLALLDFAICYDAGTDTMGVICTSNTSDPSYIYYYYEYFLSTDMSTWSPIFGEHAYYISSNPEVGANLYLKVVAYCNYGDSTSTEITKEIKTENGLILDNFGQVSINSAVPTTLSTALYVLSSDLVTITNINGNFIMHEITNLSTSTVLASSTNTYSNTVSNFLANGDTLFITYECINTPSFTCYVETFTTVYIVPTLLDTFTIDLCPSDSVTLSVPDEYDSYLWSTGATTDTINVTTEGTYTLTVTTGTVTQTTTFYVAIPNNLPVPFIINANTGDPMPTNTYLALRAGVTYPGDIDLTIEDETLLYGPPTGYPTGTTVEWLGYGVPGDITIPFTAANALGSTFTGRVAGITGVSCSVDTPTINITTRDILATPTLVGPDCPGGTCVITPHLTPDTAVSYKIELYDLSDTLIESITTTNVDESFSPVVAGDYYIIAYAYFADGIDPWTSDIPVTVTDPIAITAISYTSTNATCNGLADGSITITGITGGTAPYTYYLNDVPVSGTYASGLIADSYILSVIDANGCSFVGDTITITEPTIISTTATIVNTTGGLNNGTASFVNSGGTLPYVTRDLYDSLANLIGSGTSFTGLAANSYIYYVVDTNNCTLEYPFTIT